MMVDRMQDNEIIVEIRLKLGLKILIKCYSRHCVGSVQQMVKPKCAGTSSNILIDSVS
jgi:hypothetical protein